MVQVLSNLPTEMILRNSKGGCNHCDYSPLLSFAILPTWEGLVMQFTSPPRNGLITIHIHLPVDVANVLQILK